MAQEITIEAYIEHLKQNPVVHQNYSHQHEPAFRIALGLIIAGYEQLCQDICGGRRDIYRSFLQVEKEVKLNNERCEFALRKLFEVHGHRCNSGPQWVCPQPTKENDELVTDVITYFNIMRFIGKNPVSIKDYNHNQGKALDIGIKIKMHRLDGWWPYGYSEHV